MATKKNLREELAANLPSAGEDRWWQVKHNPKSRTKPIVLNLMESVTPGHKAMSRIIGFEFGIASVKDLTEKAELVLARVSDYDKIVGSYGFDET